MNEDTARVVCVDVGTTNIKVGAQDARGELLHLAQAPTPGDRGANTVMAVDLEACFQAVVGLLCQLTEQDASLGGRVEAVAVTGQRATVAALDEGEHPLACLSWQDLRGGQELAGLAAELPPGEYSRITGLPPFPFCSLARLLWLRAHRPELLQRARRLVIPAADLLRRLGAPDHFIDPSNASATGLYDLTEGAWSEPLLRAASVDAACLPALRPAGEVVGSLGEEAARATGLRQGIPLVLGGGDQQCASLGMGVLDSGALGLALGTSAALTTCLDALPAAPPPGLIHLAHVLPGRVLQEGFMGAFGSTLDWIAGLLGKAKIDRWNLDELRARADQLPLVVPALAGLASPDFDLDARGAVLGLTMEHGPAEVALGAILGLALELRRIRDSLDSEADTQRLIIDGQPGGDSPWQELVAAALQQEAATHLSEQPTLLGLACLAWCSVGRFASPEEAARALVRPATSSPRPPARWDGLEPLYQRYLRGIHLVRGLDREPT